MKGIQRGIPGPATRERLRAVFATARELDASDIHLHPGHRPVVRANGRLFHLKGFGKISGGVVQEIVDTLLDQRQAAPYRKTHQVDTSAKFGRLGVPDILLG